MISQTEQDYRASGGGKTQTDMLYDILTRSPGEWFSMPLLAERIGAYAVHSRIADVRRRLYQEGRGRIENRQAWDPDNRKRLSFYSFTPKVLG